MANYDDHRGLLHQADEVRSFIQELRVRGVNKKLSIIAHSMGGMSARSYIADHQVEAIEQVVNFITYSSPHWGSVFSSIVQYVGTPGLDVGTAPGAADLDYDCDDNLIGESVLDYSKAPFLDALRNKYLTTLIRYVAIRGEGLGKTRAFTQGCLSQFWDGVIPIDSANFGALPENTYLIDNHVYYTGPDGILQDVGPLSDWLPKAGCQPPPPVDCLFNWAENNYPGLFAPSGAPTAIWDVYTYRYYSATNAYVGVSSADNHVYYMGADGRLLDEGALSDWLPRAGCQ